MENTQQPPQMPVGMRVSACLPRHVSPAPSSIAILPVTAIFAAC